MMAPAQPLRPASPLERIVWSIDQGRPGPTSVYIACMHGNEPMALRALHRLHDQLQAAAGAVHGRVCAVIGNCRATAAGVRYVDSDLNRAFRYRPGRHPAVELPLAPGTAEHAEALGLIDVLSTLASEHAGQPLYVVDLHTFSGAGQPFVVLSDTLRNRAFARCWPLPLILGLSERLEGTLTDYLTACGCIAAVIETGQHDDPRSGELHLAALRLALVQAGHVQDGMLSDSDEDRSMLAEAARALPRVLDVQVRHGVRDEDAFVMRPGFANFDVVQRGDHLADAAIGPVHAERSGRLLLPLYQKQGDDGYFIARPIGRIWLQISAQLRRAGMARVGAWLPGVSSEGMIPGTLRVDRSIARWLAEDVFHLLGYRLVRRQEELLLVSRHHWDRHEPDMVRITLQ